MSDQDDITNTDKINLPENISSDNSTKILINLEKYEDGQNISIENNRLTNKSTHIEDEKYSASSLPWRDLYPQVLASCISLLIVIQPGINLAYSNNLLHYLPLLNKGQLSWITSIMALFTPMGAFVVGPIMDRIGRKKACLLTCLPLLTSWTISAVSDSDNIYMFYVSRMLAGIGGGMTTVGLVYVSEISHASYKQLLLSLNSVFFSGGVLLSTTLVYLPWYVVNYSFIAYTIVNMALIIMYMPESPIWLLKFKSSENIGKAGTAMKQIYPRNSQAFRAEWKRLKAMSSSSSSHDAAATSTPADHQNPPKSSFVQSLRSSPAAYKPMVIMTVLLLFQQLSGAYPVISYALPVVKSIVADGASFTEAQALAALGVIRFAASLLTCALSFYAGRRPLLMCSCSGMALSCALVAFTYADPAVTSRSLPPSDTAVPPAALCGVMLFVFSSSLGVLVFPWTLICELLSTPVRAIGSSLLVSYSYLLMFAVLKAFPYVLAALSLPNVFLVFGAVSLAMATYVHFVVPETLGKTFQEVENHFTRPNDKT